MNLQFKEQYHQTLLFVSPELNDKGLSVMSNLAFSFSQIGKRVLLIEGDLHRPRLHRIYDLKKESGLSDLLQKRVELMEAIHPIQANLHVLPSGSLVSNPSLLLKSKQMERLIHLLKPHYDFIFISSPPMVIVSDALCLSRFTDGVLLLIKQEASRKKSVQDCKTQLDRIKAPLIGAIVTHTKVKKTDYSQYLP